MAQPADKNPEIRNLQSEIMGTDVNEAIQANKCVSCGNLATDFDNALSIVEFSISGLCQDCQNDVFEAGDPDDDYEDEWEEDHDEDIY